MTFARVAPLLPLALLLGCANTYEPSGPSGTTPDGAFTLTGSDRCATGQLTCGANATCLDGPSRCVCDNGYQGDGGACSDIDECTNGYADCSSFATCTNYPGGYTCTCNPGFTGDGRSCLPVQQCQDANGGCDVHAQCASVDGGVTCTCETGYAGDGTSCTATGVCGTSAAQCDPHASCANVPGGGYVCTCEPGWTGNGKACTVVNDCTSGLAQCGPDTVCTPNLTQGGYTCPCASGYALKGGVCKDIDECTNGTATCAPGATCTNSPGSYFCTCPVGYTGDGHSCKPINACSPSPCDPNAACSNLGAGNFSCQCNSGYSGDGYVCNPIDPCLPDAGAICPANSTCASPAPGKFKCTCDTGYSGTDCTPVNPCTDGTASCPAHASCANIAPGQFSCTCDPGFTGSGLECTPIDPCALGTAVCPANSTCVASDGGYSCPCLSGFTQSSALCVDINECLIGTANCNGSAACVNTPGSFYCYCPPGNEGGAECGPLAKGIGLGDEYGCSVADAGSDAGNADGGGLLDCWGESPTGALGLGVADGGPADGGGFLDAGPVPEVLVPTTIDATDDWTVISTGSDHACGIRADGSLWCWGTLDNSGGYSFTPTQIQVGPTWADVAAGTTFTCALQSTGTLWCWGMNSVGQVGDGTMTDSTMPHQIGGSTEWEVITAGDHHACGMQSGQLWCWGGNEDGQLGLLNGAAQELQPTLVTNETDWATVRAGATHTCALKGSTTGINVPLTLWCWGNNASGQLGVGVTSTAGPQQVTTTGDSAGFLAVAGGYAHTCAVKTDNTAWCWGDNTFGELGVGSTLPASVPLSLAGSDWVAIGAGNGFSCGVHKAGATSCWGSNDGARLGIGSDASSTVPVSISTSTSSWGSVAAGGSSACAIDIDSNLYCWGNNSSGQLGIGPDNGSQKIPSIVPPPADQVWDHVCVGAAHACGVTDEGDLLCWGDNTYGQLGSTPSTTPTVSPTRVPGVGGNWTAVSCGSWHTCGLELAPNGGVSLYCWGRNDSGQVGVAPSGITQGITQITNPAHWTGVGTGDAHTCAIDSASDMWCWGDNTYGQLGIGSFGNPQNNTISYVASPTAVANGVTNFGYVFLGTGVSCGITVPNSGAGQLYCWGLNNLGQLDQPGSVANQSVPAVIDPPQGRAPGWYEGPNTGSAGAGQVCAIDGAGTLWCWGQNAKGELGNGQSGKVDSPPSEVGGDFYEVAAGTEFTCGLSSSAPVVCMGLNSIGQLGDDEGWQPVPQNQQ